MCLELLSHPDEETGGFLLGYLDQHKAKIFEATDGGMGNAVHKANEFQYDAVYVEHICNMVSRLYDPPLALIGVWHSHTHCLEPFFSVADEQLHKKLVDAAKSSCISILFQKTAKQKYCMRAFVIGEEAEQTEVRIRIK